MSDLKKRIEARAHQLYLQRGGRAGDAMSDWLRAEKEIMAEEKTKQSAGPTEEAKPARKKKKNG
jgi:hypothetical protein